MKPILHETQILGPIYSYVQYLDRHKIIIEKNENYQKRSPRNRYEILTANGLCSLSIPLKKGKNQQKNIAEVTISYDEPWHLKHLHALRSAYGKSAYFEFYYDRLQHVYMQKHSSLLTFNTELLKLMLHFLKLDIIIDFTDTYLITYDEQLIEDFRNQLLPTSLNFEVYPQVWSGKFDFISNLSILDLLFCMGPESVHNLRQTKILNNKIQTNSD